MKKVLCTGWIPGEVVAEFADKIELDTFPVENGIFPREEVLARLPDYDGVLAIMLKGDKEFIDLGMANKLKVLGNFGAGYDNIDWQYATKVGLPVNNTPTAVTEPTAELSILLLMNAMRDIGRIDKRVRESRTFFRQLFYANATTVYGKTLGILGLGRIGKSVARKAKGLGMNVIYFDPIRAEAAIEQELGITYQPVEEVLKNADAITLHMPFMPQTHHFMNAEKFALMKKGAYFVNASRGAVVEESALLDALRNGHLAGAGLDVFEFEPQVPDELYEMENVFLTPHIGTMAWDARCNMAREGLNGIVAVLDGEIPYNCINKCVFEKDRPLADTENCLEKES